MIRHRLWLLSSTTLCSSHWTKRTDQKLYVSRFQLIAKVYPATKRVTTIISFIFVWISIKNWNQRRHLSSSGAICRHWCSMAFGIKSYKVTKVTSTRIRLAFQNNWILLPRMREAQKIGLCRVVKSIMSRWLGVIDDDNGESQYNLNDNAICMLCRLAGWYRNEICNLGHGIFGAEEKWGFSFSKIKNFLDFFYISELFISYE